MFLPRTLLDSFDTAHHMFTVSSYKQNIRRLVGALLPFTMMGSLCAQDINEPFSYPTGLLDAPATLTTPVGNTARIGKPKIILESTKLADLADLTGATRLSEGRDAFRRDTLCLTGTDHGKPVIAWFIATDSEYVTEAQLAWVKDQRVPEFCRRLPPEQLPIQLGKVGLGMTQAEVQDLLGPASSQDTSGWHYWFSQRFFRNDRGLQELELNWLAVRFDQNGLVSQAFISQVTNL